MAVNDRMEKEMDARGAYQERLIFRAKICPVSRNTFNAGEHEYCIFFKFGFESAILHSALVKREINFKNYLNVPIK